MKATFKDFIQNAPIYKKFDVDPEAIYIFDNILSNDQNIIAMIDASEMGIPALSACLSQIEQYYSNHSNPTFDLKDNFTKQALGNMVRIILEPFGYRTKIQKYIPKSYKPKFVTSATTFAKTGPANMKVVKRIEEV